VSRKPVEEPEPPEEVEDDAALVARFRAGDRLAFDRLVRRHQRPLYFFLLRQVRDHDEAAELTQRTLVRAFQKIHALRDDGSLRTWLFRIAVRFSLNHVRDRSRYSREDEAPEPIAEPVSHERLQEAEDSIRLRMAVAKLPEKQRLTVELRVYDGLAFSEVAEILESTENTVKVNYHHAVTRLKEWLKELP